MHGQKTTSNFFFCSETRALHEMMWKNMVQTARHATDDSIIWRMGCTVRAG